MRRSRGRQKLVELKQEVAPASLACRCVVAKWRVKDHLKILKMATSDLRDKTRNGVSRRHPQGMWVRVAELTSTGLGNAFSDSMSQSYIDKLMLKTATQLRRRAAALTSACASPSAARATLKWRSRA